MDYTKNYHLPQWKKEDRIMMEDFNDAMARIENGITEAQDAAQTVADSAYTASNKPYAVGSYTGSNQSAQTINLGFRPRFIIICGTDVSSGNTWFATYSAISGGHAVSGAVSFTATGFTVKPVGSNEYPKLTQSRAYDYIAFR